MIDILWVLPLAMILGIIVGMLPGMSSVIGIMLAMPIIGQLPITVILLFFACYLCVVQYYGSVSALLLRIPGETSSLPVLIASQGLHGRPLIKSIRITALTSFIASSVGLIVFSAMFMLDRNIWTGVFNTKVLVIFLIVMFLLLILKERVWMNVCLILLGLFVSNLHEMPLMFQACSQSQWLCFILQPTDITLILLGIYSVPILFGQAINTNTGQDTQVNNSVRWKTFWPYRWLSIKYGLLGLVIGFVPGMGVTLASNISAKLQLLKKPHNRLAIMGASEASNNSATISSMIPFLMIGLPITASELYLDNWLSVFRNTQVNFEIFYQTIDLGLVGVPYYVLFVACLFVINLMAFFLSSRFTRLYQSISVVPVVYINGVIKGFIIMTIPLVIWLLNIDPVMAMVTLAMSGVLGVWAHKHKIDVIALPISLVVGKYAFDIFTKAYYLYF